MLLTQQELKHQNSAIHPDLETVTATEVLPAVQKLRSRLKLDKSPCLTWTTNTAL